MTINQPSKIKLKNPLQKAIFEGVIAQYIENRDFLKDIGVNIEEGPKSTIASKIRYTVHSLKSGQYGLKPDQWDLLNEKFNQLPADKREYWLKLYGVKTT